MTKRELTLLKDIFSLLSKTRVLEIAEACDNRRLLSVLKIVNEIKRGISQEEYNTLEAFILMPKTERIALVNELIINEIEQRLPSLLDRFTGFLTRLFKNKR